MKFEGLMEFWKSRMNLRRRIATMVLGAVACFACMAASGGCGTDLHKASVAADSIGSSLHTAAQINHDDAMESPADRAMMAAYIDSVAKLNDAFVHNLQAAEANGGQVSSVQIAAAFAALNTQARQLNSTGALHLKSADAQEKFEQVTMTIDSLLNTIQALLPANSSEKRSPVKHRVPIGYAALALTAEEIEQLIALVLAAAPSAISLIEKLTAMKSETDEQLQADALAEDAKAEAIAEADENEGGTSEPE